MQRKSANEAWTKGKENQRSEEKQKTKQKNTPTTSQNNEHARTYNEVGH